MSWRRQVVSRLCTMPTCLAPSSVQQNSQFLHPRFAGSPISASSVISQFLSIGYIFLYATEMGRFFEVPKKITFAPNDTFLLFIFYFFNKKRSLSATTHTCMYQIHNKSTSRYSSSTVQHIEIINFCNFGMINAYPRQNLSFWCR
jgi:hypothetical protein